MSVFSATIKWGRVECELRNGPIYGYRASYYPTSNSSDKSGTVVLGTNEDARKLTIIRLQPHTSYTFEVMAINLAILAFSPATTITIHTTVPDRELSSYISWF